MMIGMGLPNLPEGPFWILLMLAVRVAVAAAIAYYAKRKGYNLWVFLAAALLFDPIASLIILLAIPRRNDCAGGCASPLPIR